MGELLGTADLATSMLKVHEGYRRVPYRDTRGKLSAAYGRNLDDEGIDQEEAEYLLRRDVARAMRRLSNYHWYLQCDTVRQAVLVDIAINVGVEGLLKFERMIAALEKQDYCAAATEIITSKAAGELPHRYRELAQLMDSHGAGQR